MLCKCRNVLSTCVDRSAGSSLASPIPRPARLESQCGAMSFQSFLLSSLCWSLLKKTTRRCYNVFILPITLPGIASESIPIMSLFSKVLRKSPCHTEPQIVDQLVTLRYKLILLRMKSNRYSTKLRLIAYSEYTWLDSKEVNHRTSTYQFSHISNDCFMFFISNYVSAITSLGTYVLRR